MKIAALIIRILIGLLLLFGSIVFFLKLFPEPALQGNMKTFNDGIKASGYLMPLVKTIELICGLSYVTGKFNRFTYILFMPIAVNILCTHLFLAPEGLPVACFVFFGNIFLLYSKWDDYKRLFLP